MSRYFFDLVDHDRRMADRCGEELDDVHEARDHAQAIVAQVIREQLPNGEHVVCICEVRDDRDNVVYRASLTFKGQQATP